MKKYSTFSWSLNWFMLLIHKFGPVLYALVTNILLKNVSFDYGQWIKSRFGES